MKKIFLLLSFTVQFLFAQNSKVLTGADILLSDSLDLVTNKNVGIVTNHTGLLSNGTHIVDTLNSLNQVNVVVLFGPEHGIRGDAPDGHSISDGKDSKTGIQVYSLYGKTKKPTKEMLKNVDILVFDIQDIGARFYTYISTMFFAMQAAVENNIPILILDRPNPINGIRVEGPIIQEGFKSFVGIANIPIMHGMTIGELALFFNEENLLNENLKADFKIIKMQNWTRNMYFDETGLTWVNPSPNMTSLETALLYPGLCLIEGTNISEGRGTPTPFLNIGAPFINSDSLISKLNSYKLEGISYSKINFTPVEIPNMASKPKFEKENCNGIYFTITDRQKLNSLKLGLVLIYSIMKLNPNDFSFRESSIDRLYGSSNLRTMLTKGFSPNEIMNTWKQDLEKFNQIRKKYLIYN